MTVLDEIEAAIPSLRRYAHALARNRDVADDLVQDCLERAVSRRREWRGDGPVRAWLFKILQNLHKDRLRGEAGTAKLVPIDNVGERAGSGGQEESLDLREVHEAIGRLPPDQRAALLLVVLEGLPLAEAADVLNIPQGTLQSRIARARSALRQWTGRTGGGLDDRKKAQ